MKDPFAPNTTPRLKPVDVMGFSDPIELRPGAQGSASLTIGRAEDNDVALTGGNFPSVSSHHVRIDLHDGLLVVRDLGSKNGTLVNGAPITDDRELKVGDQVRLGSVGPRFVVVGTSELDETVFIRNEGAGSTKGDVEEIVHQEARSTMRRVVVLVTILAAAIGWFVWDLTQDRARLESADQVYADELEEASAQIAALEERERTREAASALDAEQRAERIRQLEENLAERTAELERTMTERAAEEGRLQAQIDDLEQRGASREEVAQVQAELLQARTDLDTTREELTAARRRVDLFDPVSLAQARLSGVGQVRRSVVLIESKTRVRNVETGATLHFDESATDDEVNFEGRGEEFSLESTGSGFSVSPEGWIVTNRHVVVPPDSPLLRAFSRSPEFEVVVDLRVVFSGDSTRHVARVEKVASSGVDLALVKIEPFEGMPALNGFRTDVAAPPAGSDIYLFGFPLGHLAVQEGETVIASTFRGILSRNVGGQMQVDAGVHPGNSGGPITDTEGRVVGVVVSVQALPDRTAVYTIGYGIPIGEAARIWPPAERDQ